MCGRVINFFIYSSVAADLKDYSSVAPDLKDYSSVVNRPMHGDNNHFFLSN